MDKNLEELAAQLKKVAAQSGAELGEVREVAANLAEEAAGIVRKYPLQSVFGAAAIGFLLGSLLSKRK